MEAAIAAFPPPQSYQNVLSYINETWGQLIDEYEGLSVTIRNEKSEAVLRYINIIATDPKMYKVTHVIVGLGLIYRFFMTKMERLYHLFDYLFTSEEYVDYMASSHLITDISKATLTTNSDFSLRYLSKSYSLIEDPLKHQKTTIGLTMLQLYMQKIPSFVLLHYPKISEKLVPCIYSGNQCGKRCA